MLKSLKAGYCIAVLDKTYCRVITNNLQFINLKVLLASTNLIPSDKKHVTYTKCYKNTV